MPNPIHPLPDDAGDPGGGGYRPRRREAFDVQRHDARLQVIVTVTACLVWLMTATASSYILMTNANAAAGVVAIIDAAVTPIAVVVKGVFPRRKR